jgi:hypothetical protein
MPDALADRVSLNQDELTNDFTGMNGGGIHDGSPMNVGGDSTCPHRPPRSRYVDSRGSGDLGIIGPDTAARLLEVGASDAEGIEFVVHATPARDKFLEA